MIYVVQVPATGIANAIAQSRTVKQVDAALADALALAAAISPSTAAGRAGGEGSTADSLVDAEVASGAPLAVLAAATSALGGLARGLMTASSLSPQQLSTTAAAAPEAAASATAAAEAAVRAAYLPLEAGLGRYGELEAACLRAGLPLPPVVEAPASSAGFAAALEVPGPSFLSAAPPTQSPHFLIFKAMPSP